MVEHNISDQILKWYDINKRNLPWRYPKSKKQSEYFTLVSEVMLQQTQVKTVIPYFNRFVKVIPNMEALSKISESKLLKLWEGLGYYSRARNLKKTATIIKKNLNSKLPNSINELKKLPGIGDYTSRAILALEFDKKVIPLDGNIERIIKRLLFLKKNKEIKKNYLMSKTIIFGNSIRQRDYVQALMELGSLICKPNDPLCELCPINKRCISFKKNDFVIKKKTKKNKTKYFKANIYIKRNKTFLIKNEKFTFLKDFLIFPMIEVKKLEYDRSNEKKINLKLSNMDMKILIKKNKKISVSNGQMINQTKINSRIIPSFTKKLFKVALNS